MQLSRSTSCAMQYELLPSRSPQGAYGSLRPVPFWAIPPTERGFGISRGLGVLTSFSRIAYIGVADWGRLRKRPLSYLTSLSFDDLERSAQMLAYLLDDSGDMVERGLIMAAIVVAAVAIWMAIGERLAIKLGIVRDTIK